MDYSLERPLGSESTLIATADQLADWVIASVLLGAAFINGIIERSDSVKLVKAMILPLSI